MNYFRMSFAILICIAPLTSCDAASSSNLDVTVERTALVERSEPMLTGVATHFGIQGKRNYVPALSVGPLTELGVDSYRDDIPWIDYDPEGSDRSGTLPPRLLTMLMTSRLTPLLIPGHSNPNVPEGNPPVTDTGRASYDAFITDIVQKTASYSPMYEIWNEWNINAEDRRPMLRGPGGPEDKRAATYYAKLAQSALPVAIKDAPKATILYGAVGDDHDWSWTKAMVDELKPDARTSLSVHLYNMCYDDLSKRTATEMIDRLENLQKTLNPGAPPRPVYVTEFGWPTGKHRCSVTPEMAAANMAQFLLWSAATPWLKGAWVYELKDSGRNENDVQDNFGLYDYDFVPHPQACAVREAVRFLKGAKRFEIKRPSNDLFVVQVDTPDGVRMAVWTTSQKRGMRLSVAGDAPVTARHLCNGSVQPSEGAFKIGDDPVILDVAGVERVALHFQRDE